MTQKRRDSHSTQFGLWLREQPEIDSAEGYVATNVDYLWRNYKTGDWMLIEEKRNLARPAGWQIQLFALLSRACPRVPGFQGFPHHHL